MKKGEPNLEVKLQEITEKFVRYIQQNKLTQSEILLITDVHECIISGIMREKKYGVKSKREEI